LNQLKKLQTFLDTLSIEVKQEIQAIETNNNNHHHAWLFFPTQVRTQLIRLRICNNNAAGYGRLLSYFLLCPSQSPTIINLFISLVNHLDTAWRYHPLVYHPYLARTNRCSRSEL